MLAVNSCVYLCQFRCAHIQEDTGRLTEGVHTVVGISKLLSESKHELVGFKSFQGLHDMDWINKL